MDALRVLLAVSLIAWAGMASGSARAEGQPGSGPAPGEAWKQSPFHGAIDGDGNRIPCLCRFKGQEFRLGTAVCMNTHVGTVIAKCDLLYNNTTWVPTSEPCTVSRAPVPQSFPPAG